MHPRGPAAPLVAPALTHNTPAVPNNRPSAISTTAIRDKSTGQWMSKAEVAEAPFVAFRSRKLVEQVEGRLVVRRIPELNPKQVEQPTLFDTYRHRAFFTTTANQAMSAVAADKTRRAHAIIEQVHADLKAGSLANLPSGAFTANSAWLVRATTATIRRALISVPARIARSARRIAIHLPGAWPWQAAFDRLFTTTHAPPSTATT